jgi:hypothetical protein
MTNSRVTGHQPIIRKNALGRFTRYAKLAYMQILFEIWIRTRVLSVVTKHILIVWFLIIQI